MDKHDDVVRALETSLDYVHLYEAEIGAVCVLPQNTVRDAIDLLKPVKPVHNDALVKCGWDDVYNCGACGNQLRGFANYCDKCGRKVEKAEKAVRRGKKIRL